MQPVDRHPAKCTRAAASAVAVMLLAPLLGDCTLDPTYAYGPSPGSSAVSIIGTPFLIAFKVPACAATLALGVPLAAATGLADPYQRQPWAIRYEIDHAVTANCGPPWVLPPYP
jgi:hypothetical protein